MPLSPCYLGGGGSESDESQLWDQLFTNPDPTTHHIAVWPWAQPQSSWPDLQAWVASAVAPRGIPASHVTLGTSPPAFGLDEADVLVIPGGNAFELLDHMRTRGLMQALKQAHARGSVRVYGGSAGALVQGRDVSIIDAAIGGLDDNTIGMEDCTAADFLGGWSVYPHFEGGFVGRLAELCRKWSRERGIKVMGIPEKCGVKVEGGEWARNAGPEDVWCFEPNGKEWVVKAGERFPLRDLPRPVEEEDVVVH